MSSPLLALFARSLREDVRTWPTYVARAGLVLLILLFLLAVPATLGWGNAPGLRFFSAVAFINLFFILLAGLSYFASAIAEEKEEMTLGLLRMTNLDPLSILLGKSTSRLAGALLLLAAQLPFALLAVALGGVAVRQIAAAYCTLGAFLVLLANLALLASVICRRTTGAAVLTGLMLLAFYAVLPLLQFIAMIPVRVGVVRKPGALLLALERAADFVELSSPLHRLGQILRTGFADALAGAQVCSNLALGAGCFALAWLVFDRFCAEQEEAGPRRARARPGRRARRSPGRVWRAALAWKDFNFLAGGKVWMSAKFVLYGMALTWVASRHRSWGTWNAREFGYFTLWLMFLVASVELAFLSASLFHQERKSKTLSSLAMLPMTVRRLAYEKILGGLIALLPAAAYFSVGLACVSDQLAIAWRNFWDHSLSRGNWELLYGVSYAVAAGLFFLHYVAWTSLFLKRGALPLAIAANLIVHLFIAISTEMQFNALVIFALLFAGGSVVLHGKIGKRLEALAAED